MFNNWIWIAPLAIVVIGIAGGWLLGREGYSRCWLPMRMKRYRNRLWFCKNCTDVFYAKYDEYYEEWKWIKVSEEEMLYWPVGKEAIYETSSADPPQSSARGNYDRGVVDLEARLNRLRSEVGCDLLQIRVLRTSGSSRYLSFLHSVPGNPSRVAAVRSEPIDSSIPSDDWIRDKAASLCNLFLHNVSVPARPTPDLTLEWIYGRTEKGVPPPLIWMDGGEEEWRTLGVITKNFD